MRYPAGTSFASVVMAQSCELSGTVAPPAPMVVCDAVSVTMVGVCAGANAAASTRAKSAERARFMRRF